MVRTALPSPTFQNRTVLSLPPETTLVPSAVTATARTASVWPGERAENGAVVQVEDLDRLVGRRGVDLGAVGVGGDREDRPFVPGEDPHGGRLPDPDRTVGTRRDDRRVVRPRCRLRRSPHDERRGPGARGRRQRPRTGPSGRPSRSPRACRRPRTTRTGPGPRDRRRSPRACRRRRSRAGRVLSAEPATSLVPSRLSCTARTASPWPPRVANRPSPRSRSRASPSCRPSPRRAGCRPAGEGQGVDPSPWPFQLLDRLAVSRR